MVLHSGQVGLLLFQQLPYGGEGLRVRYKSEHDGIQNSKSHTFKRHET